MRRTTTVNGTDVKILDSQQGTPRETNARRVAAALERADPAVDRVIPSVGDSVAVWLSGTDGHDDGRSRRFHAPDGWAIAYSDVSENGSVAVTLRPADD